MSELKIEVSDERKQLTALEEMRNFLKTLPGVKPKKGDKDFHEDMISFYCINDYGARGIAPTIIRDVSWDQKTERTEYKKQGRFFPKKIATHATSIETESKIIYVGVIVFKEKMIRCDSEADFENLKALAVKFKFRKLVKNWPGAK